VVDEVDRRSFRDREEVDEGPSRASEMEDGWTTGDGVSDTKGDSDWWSGGVEEGPAHPRYTSLSRVPSSSNVDALM